MNFCCLYCGQGNSNLKIFAFVVKRKCFTTFFVGLIWGLESEKYARVYRLIFLVTLSLVWCTLNWPVFKHCNSILALLSTVFVLNIIFLSIVFSNNLTWNRKNLKSVFMFRDIFCLIRGRWLGVHSLFLDPLFILVTDLSRKKRPLFVEYFTFHAPLMLKFRLLKMLLRGRKCRQITLRWKMKKGNLL